jgi:hypothetical protein
VVFCDKPKKGGEEMKNSEVEGTLIVKIIKLGNILPDGYFIEPRHTDARKEGETGVVFSQVQTFNQGDAWFVIHDRDGRVGVYFATEFEPFSERAKIEVEAYITTTDSRTRNECIICGKDRCVAIVSFWLSVRLGIHILVPFCVDHLNDVDILKGVGKALLKEAEQIEKGVTWRKILEERAQASGAKQK